MIYLVFITIMTILYYVLIKKKKLSNDLLKKNKIIFCTIISILLLLILTLKHDLVGTDTQNYRLLFDLIRENEMGNLNSDLFTSEIGFHYFIYYLSELNEFKIVLLFVNLLYLTTISYYIYKYSKNLWLSYFLFLTIGYLFFSTTMRQCIAWSLCLIALEFALKNKLTMYLVFVAIASSFHVTAFIFLPTYWLIKMNLTFNKIVLSSIVVLLIILMSSTITNYFIYFLGKEYERSQTGGKLNMLFYFVIFIWGYNRFGKNPNYNHLLILLLILLTISPLSFYNPFFSRIYKYFDLAYILILPNIISTYKVNKSKTIIILTIISLGLFNFYYITPKAGIRNIPYVFYWEDYYLKNPAVKDLNLISN